MCEDGRIAGLALDLEALDLVLKAADLAHEVGGFVGRDAAGNDGAGDTAGAALFIESAICNLN